MNMKKILRGPIIYIVLAIVAVWIGSSLITTSGFREVSTQEGLELLSDGKVAAAKIVDGENRVDLTLTKADGDLGTQVQFYYVTPRGDDVVNAVDQANPADGFNDEVPQPNWFLSMLGILLPLVLIGLFFWIMLSGMQGGGNKVMQFGKSKAKLVTKESPQGHVRRRRRRRRGHRGAPRDQGVPQGAREVPGGRRAHPEGRAALRPSRNRQDAARPRRRG